MENPNLSDNKTIEGLTPSPSPVERGTITFSEAASFQKKVALQNLHDSGC
jgi:hypothetical protein